MDLYHREPYILKAKAQPTHNTIRAKTYKDKIKSWDLLKNNKRSGKYLQKHRRDSSERMRDTQEHAAPHSKLQHIKNPHRDPSQ